MSLFNHENADVSLMPYHKSGILTPSQTPSNQSVRLAQSR
jgi:hypothetical protein